MASKKEKRQEKLKKVKREEEERAAQRKAEQLGLPYKDLRLAPIDNDSLALIPKDKAERARLAAVAQSGNHLVVVTTDPSNDLTEEIIRDLKKQRYKPQLFLVSQNAMKRVLERYTSIAKKGKKITGEVKITEEAIGQKQREVTTFNGLRQTIKNNLSASTTELLEAIIGGALSLEASDVHFEAREKETKVRYRIDGILQDITKIPSNPYESILSRIKLLAGLKLNVHNKAQDGRFTIEAKNPIEVRVSILPAKIKEAIVLRILNPKEISLTLEDLGFRKDAIEIMKKEIKKPNGMILTTGPTGSGKTTTLYAFLKKVNKPEIKIITIEDPVEYRLQGIEQTQVNKDEGYDFSNGLKSILRQDPDVILVGEIRDADTATTAAQAALTGHLVFSTLHTNDAAGAIPRLIELGVQKDTIPAALNTIMAQRLVRRLCPICKKKKKPSKKERKIIEKQLKKLPENISEPKGEIYEPGAKKCQNCNETGYKGRIAIIEIFVIDNEMGEVILSSPTHAKIKSRAIERGMITLTQGAIIKILEGITSFEEAERVVVLE